MAVPESGDSSPDEPISSATKTVQISPSPNTHEQAGPPIPPLTKPEKLPEEVDTSTIEPRWNISKTFKSREECEIAASVNRRNGSRDESKYPDFFRYGIRFSPLDSEHDVYRTIIISNISPGITVGTILNHVRGGIVINATLLDTVKITGKKSALITFLHEHAAMAFEDHANKYPVIIGGVPAQIKVISTPTYPMRITLRKAIFDHRQTRCLEVYNFPEQISAQRLRNDLAICMETNITYMQKRKDVLKLEFSSIAYAGLAFDILSGDGGDGTYQCCTPYFVPDPCAQALETINNQQIACLAEPEMVTKDATAPDPEPAAVDRSGRLARG